jgi:hypothetical protein
MMGSAVTCLILAAWQLLLPAMTDAGETTPSEQALRLIPSDTAAVLLVSDLRSQLPAIANSSLVQRACELPFVRAWFDSNDFTRFQNSRKELEAALGVSWQTLRDDLIGDAVLLCLQAGDGPNGFAQPRGLLVTRVRDVESLRSLIGRINGGETAEGTLVSVDQREHRGVRYFVRLFRPQTKHDEAYVILDDRWFAWSNSEQSIREVIDRRQNEGEGFAGGSEIVALRKGLPSDALVSLYVGPLVTAEVEKALKNSSEAREPLPELLAGIVGAVRAFGLAVRWDEGVLVDLHEVIEVDHLPGSVKALVNSSRSSQPILPRLAAPGGWLAILSVRADWQAVADLARSVVPEESRSAWDGGEAVLQGLLLGYAPRTEVAPAIGPGATVTLIPAAEGSERLAELVAVVPVAGDPSDPRGIPSAIRNALRTGAGMVVLDDLEKNRSPVRRLSEAVVDGLSVTVLGTTDRTTLAFAISGGQWILGTSSRVVADAVKVPTSSLLDRVPDTDRAAIVLGIDLELLVQQARIHREVLVRRLATTGGGTPEDLDRALQLIGLFRLGFVVHAIAEDRSSAHQQFGLIGRAETR